MIHFCIHPLSTQPPVWQSPRTGVHSDLSRTCAHSSYFPRLRAKLFNFFILRLERLLATDHLLGMEIVTGLACSGLKRKKISFLHSVCGTYHLLRFDTSCRRAEVCRRIFFFLSLLRTIERRIRDNCRSFRRDDSKRRIFSY